MKAGNHDPIWINESTAIVPIRLPTGHGDGQACLALISRVSRTWPERDDNGYLIFVASL